MSEVGLPPRGRPTRTIVVLTALVVLAGVVDVVRGEGGGADGTGGVTAGPSAGQPLAVEECDATTAEPSLGDPGAVTAQMLVAYRPDETGDRPGAAQPVNVAGIVESVGEGLALLVQPCQAVAATLYGALPDGSLVEATVGPGRRGVESVEGGRVDLVDSASGARRIHGGRGGFTGFGGWYAIMSDPVPGSYPWRSDVTWRADGEVVSRGEVQVRLVLGTHPG